MNRLFTQCSRGLPDIANNYLNTDGERVRELALLHNVARCKTFGDATDGHPQKRMRHHTKVIVRLPIPEGFVRTADVEIHRRAYIPNLLYHMHNVHDDKAAPSASRLQKTRLSPGATRAHTLDHIYIQLVIVCTFTPTALSQTAFSGSAFVHCPVLQWCLSFIRHYNYNYYYIIRNIASFRLSSNQINVFNRIFINHSKFKDCLTYYISFVSIL